MLLNCQQSIYHRHGNGMMIRVATDPITSWFIDHYLSWQHERHALAPMAEFARYLETSDKSLNHWANGRNKPSYTSAVKICIKLHDYSLLDLLGYDAKSVDEVSIDFLPPELRDRLRLALLDLATTSRTRSIHPDSPEAIELSVATLKRYGFTVTKIE